MSHDVEGRLSLPHLAERMIRMARSKPLARLKQIWRDSSAVAMIEFAYVSPFILGLGMMGIETANYVITHMQVSQLAMQVADNASRLGDDTVLVAKKVYEDDINDVFRGAEELGASLDIENNGRIILSSLQANGRSGASQGQTIAWQRCTGDKEYYSSFGVEGDGKDDGDFEGMGDLSKGGLIKASSGTAVMFVEVAYDYEPLTPFELFGDSELVYTAAFNVRDDRDLTGLYQTEPASEVADCAPPPAPIEEASATPPEELPWWLRLWLWLTGRG